MRDDLTIVTQTLTCQECSDEWIDAHERWRLYLTFDDPAQPLIYCPVCANREFGD